MMAGLGPQQLPPWSLPGEMTSPRFRLSTAPVFSKCMTFIIRTTISSLKPAGPPGMVDPPRQSREPGPASPSRLQQLPGCPG